MSHGHGGVLVTGGAGFIGSRLVAALAAADAGRPILVVDNLHPQVHGPDAAPPVLPPGVTFRRADTQDGAALRACVEACDPAIVYHLAAETGTGQSMSEIARYCSVNVTGAALLLEALAGREGLRRVVLASSRAVYGEGPYRTADGRLLTPRPRDNATLRAGRFAPTDDDEVLVPVPATEATPPRPASIYGTTKLAQEHLVLNAALQATWQPVILRFQNVYGPGQSLRNPYAGVLSIFVEQVLDGRRLDIYEDGEIVRDFVYVDDVVESLVLAGTLDAPSGAVVNVGSGEGATILSVARRILRALGRPEDALDVTGRFRAGDVRHAVADVALARRLLGWEPRTSLETGLAQLIEWARVERSDLKTVRALIAEGVTVCPNSR